MQKTEVMRRLMTGNEAIARGLWEAGCTVVSAYPGTPSTEITENAAKYEEVYAEWSPNEKVALEVALGAAIGGARALCAMKHVGLNVAADVLFTAAYTGINGGLVIVSADDPGMHSSQNEQDNRHYGVAAKIPVLEPSDSGEARDFVKLAFEISERFNIPVMLRLTTRIAHSQSLVCLSERQVRPLPDYKKDVHKYVMMPGFARLRHAELEKRLTLLADYAGREVSLNRLELRNAEYGVICSGVVYQYVREALPDASILKLGISYPLSRDQIHGFSDAVKKLYIVEELDGVIETTVRSWGFDVTGKDLFGALGEIFPADIAEKIAGVKPVDIGADESSDLPQRPPVMCAGCPHRAVFYVLKKLSLTVCGDIGCYTLAADSPLSAMDTCVCMGASIGMAHGMEKARGRETAKKTVAVIGESTFLHSGITGLVNIVYNQSAVTTIILDNSITAMTGHQHNPASGRNVKGEVAPQINLEKLVLACGVKAVYVVNPFDLKEFESVLRTVLDLSEPAVIIARYPCALLSKSVRPAYIVDEKKCTGCKVCMGMGCPAIMMVSAASEPDSNTAQAGKPKSKLRAEVVRSQCNGCGLCAQVCPFEAFAGGEK